MEIKTELAPLIDILNKSKRVAVLTGAGISAESGIPTFRGEEGLWKTYRAEELATLPAFIRDPRLIWEWYDWRRGIIGSKDFNPGHKVLASWEKLFPSFHVITQNIDGLHQKAGSFNILGTVTENHTISLGEIPPHCPNCGALLRPHVVWFGESLDASILQSAFALSSSCEVMFVVGTSAVVQPAASLPLAASESGAIVVEINTDPTPITPYVDYSFRGNAGDILPIIDGELSLTNPQGEE
jgi:NAD-dependent deacetylase